MGSVLPRIPHRAFLTSRVHLPAQAECPPGSARSPSRGRRSGGRPPRRCRPITEQGVRARSSGTMFRPRKKSLRGVLCPSCPAVETVAGDRSADNSGGTIGQVDRLVPRGAWVRASRDCPVPRERIRVLPWGFARSGQAGTRMNRSPRRVSGRNRWEDIHGTGRRELDAAADAMRLIRWPCERGKATPPLRDMPASGQPASRQTRRRTSARRKPEIAAADRAEARPGRGSAIESRPAPVRSRLAPWLVRRRQPACPGERSPRQRGDCIPGPVWEQVVANPRPVRAWSALLASSRKPWPSDPRLVRIACRETESNGRMRMTGGSQLKTRRGGMPARPRSPVPRMIRCRIVSA